MLEETLNSLRELGVSIPDNLTQEQLLNQAKALCPWTLSTGTSLHGYYATTRRTSDVEAEGDSTAHAPTEAEAAMKLLLKQLNGNRYSAHDTLYKAHAKAFRANNPN